MTATPVFASNCSDRPVPRGSAALLALLLLVSHPRGAAAFCWQDAATRYGLPAALLVAIAEQESGFNSAHLPTLSRFGIGERELLDPCINVHVGAWVLAEAIARHGYSWEAVGAYNAGGSREAAPHRASYAWQNYRRLERMRTSHVSGAKR